MTTGAIRWYRAREHAGHAGIYLFLSGILSSVVSSLMGWEEGWDLATIVLSYPGLLLLLGSIIVGDVAMLCVLATRPPGKRGHWLGWLFLAGRAGALSALVLPIGLWEAKLLAARLGG